MSKPNAIQLIAEYAQVRHALRRALAGSTYLKPGAIARLQADMRTIEAKAARWGIRLDY